MGPDISCKRLNQKTSWRSWWGRWGVHSFSGCLVNYCPCAPSGLWLTGVVKAKRADDPSACEWECTKGLWTNVFVSRMCKLLWLKCFLDAAPVPFFLKRPSEPKGYFIITITFCLTLNYAKVCQAAAQWAMTSLSSVVAFISFRVEEKVQTYTLHICL